MQVATVHLPSVPIAYNGHQWSDWPWLWCRTMNSRRSLKRKRNDDLSLSLTANYTAVRFCHFISTLISRHVIIARRLPCLLASSCSEGGSINTTWRSFSSCCCWGFADLTGLKSTTVPTNFCIDLCLELFSFSSVDTTDTHTDWQWQTPLTARPIPRLRQAYRFKCTNREVTNSDDFRCWSDKSTSWEVQDVGLDAFIASILISIA